MFNSGQNSTVISLDLYMKAAEPIDKERFIETRYKQIKRPILIKQWRIIVNLKSRAFNFYSF
jgi:diphthamide synthase subunit DPH2